MRVKELSNVPESVVKLLNTPGNVFEQTNTMSIMLAILDELSKSSNLEINEFEQKFRSVCKWSLVDFDQDEPFRFSFRIYTWGWVLMQCMPDGNLKITTNSVSMAKKSLGVVYNVDYSEKPTIGSLVEVLSVLRATNHRQKRPTIRESFDANNRFTDIIEYLVSKGHETTGYIHTASTGSKYCYMVSNTGEKYDLRYSDHPGRQWVTNLVDVSGCDPEEAYALVQVYCDRRTREDGYRQESVHQQEQRKQRWEALTDEQKETVWKLARLKIGKKGPYYVEDSSPYSVRFCHAMDTMPSLDK